MKNVALATGREFELSDNPMDTILDSKWHEIAGLFNSPLIRPKFSFGSSELEVYPSKMPLCIRRPEVLGPQFEDARKKFEKHLKKWKRDGRGDPAEFQKLVSKRNGGRDEESPKAWILFKVCEYDTDRPKDSFLERNWYHRAGVKKSTADTEECNVAGNTRKRKRCSKEQQNGEDAFPEILIKKHVADRDGKAVAQAEIGNEIMRGLLNAHELIACAARSSDKNVRIAASSNYEQALEEYATFDLQTRI